MEVLGYFASLLIGISLGLIGGGGSILTVPVLVYLFSVEPMLATSYSLFVVGSTSLAGAYNSYRKNLVNFKVAFLFGVTSIITVFLTRKFIVHNIPEKIKFTDSFSVGSALLTMVLFAILMVAASISMITHGGNEVGDTPHKTRHPSKLIVLGMAIGFVTGLLGAGGGFLLIPALVLVLGLHIKEAVGTSLLIIAMNSLSGFIVDLGHFSIDWKFIIIITAIAIAGIFIGGAFAKKIEGAKLKKTFGWFVLAMGIYIIIKELLLNKITHH